MAPSDALTPGDVSGELPFRDRRARLVVLGVFAIAIGGLCLLFSGLTVLLAVAPSAVLGPGVSGGVDLRSVVPAASVYVLLGAAFIALGAGSIRARRWVRPLMLTLAWTWLLAGVLSVLGLLVLGSDTLLATAGGGEDVPAGVRSLIWIVVIGMIVVLEVLLPVLFILGYRSTEVRLTAEARNPEPSWTDGCPPRVLGLSVALGAGAVLSVPFAFSAVVPLFGRIVTGAPAALLTLAGAVVLGYLAYACYAQRPAGWWGMLALTLLLGISTVVTFLIVSPDQIARTLLLPEAQAQELEDAGAGVGRAIAGFAALFTAACVGYLLAVRKDFWTRRVSASRQQ